MSSSTAQPRPFKIAVSDAAIADLQLRLQMTRWPDQLNDDDWGYGSELGYMQSLAEYWLKDFDWRKQEATLNQFDQYLLEIDGLDCHFIHQCSPHPSARAMIVSHGWPGCIAEFIELIPRLTTPEKFGGRVEDACHVICPSLPGFGWSDAATEAGMGTRKIAQRQVTLMAALGYDDYIAQGGDWGAMVTRHMADLDPEHCKALHLNMVLAFPPADVKDPMSVATDEERARMKAANAFLEDGMGYFKIQSTRPQTLGYGLADSPVGLAAWLTEKYRAWTDCDGDLESIINRDQLLTIISLYWFSESITSSTRIYFEDTKNGHHVPHIDVPTGAAIYPKELVQSPRAWIEASYDLQHFYEAEKGGHFAALEQPQVFAEDLWRFVATLSSAG